MMLKMTIENWLGLDVGLIKPIGNELAADKKTDSYINSDCGASDKNTEIPCPSNNKYTV